MRLTLALTGLTACVAEPVTDNPESTPMVAVTFNTGGGAAPGDEPGGPTAAEVEANQELYGTGLAWGPAIEAARAWVERADPDLVAVQEMFPNGDCAAIDVDPSLDLACRDWAEGEPWVFQAVLGPAFQIACHRGKPDKCVGVHERFGTWEGCEGDLCLDALVGDDVEGCGSGARVARGVVIRPAQAPLTVVNVHGSSGITASDAACRVMQVERIFVNGEGGAPLVNGVSHLVLGDLNTDPARFQAFDRSAERWHDFVGEGKPFHWVTEVSDQTPGSYGGIGGLAVDIDHVVSDRWRGPCVAASASDVLDVTYFDHRPIRCVLQQD